MTAALSPRSVDDLERVARFVAAKNTYLPWLRKEVSPHKLSVFDSSDDERKAAIASSLENLGLSTIQTMQPPKTPGSQISSARGKSGISAPDPEDRKISPRYQVFAAQPALDSTRRPKSANAKLTPEMHTFSTEFLAVLPKALGMNWHKQIDFLRELRVHFEKPLAQIMKDSESYTKKHSWEKQIHLEIGCALLFGLQCAFGEAWDPDSKIKMAWATAYHLLISACPENKQENSIHQQVISHHKLIAYPMVRPTGKTVVSPFSKQSRIFGVNPSELPSSAATAVATASTTTTTSTPTISSSTSPTSELSPFPTTAAPQVPANKITKKTACSTPPPPDSCCVIL